MTRSRSVRVRLAVVVGVLVAIAGRPAGAQERTDAAPPAKDGRAKDDRNQPVTVDADHMERFGKESLVVFTGNVVARQNNSVQYADRVEVYLDEKGDRIVRTVSTGNVRIVTSDCRTATARRAEYFDLDQRVVLSGNARMWQEDNAVTGETITIFLSQDRTVVQGARQERVKGVFFPRDEKKEPAALAGAGPAKPPAVCQN